MSYTLYDLTYRVARELGTVQEGVATGGSTTTIIDTNDRTEANDYWNGGTVWILEDAGGASAAPEGEWGIVSDFAAASDTVTVRTALSAAVAANDKYAIAKPRYKLYLIIQMINQALMDVGRIPITDTTSVETDVNKTEYSIPVAANLDLREVWYQNVTNDVNDNRWTILSNWYIQRTDTGTADLLVFPYQLSQDHYLKLVYTDYHPELRDRTDTLSETIPIELVVYPAVLKCLEWYQNKTNSVESSMKRMLEKYTMLTNEAKVTNPIRVPKRTARVMLTRNTDKIETSVDTVTL